MTAAQPLYFTSSNGTRKRFASRAGDGAAGDQDHQDYTSPELVQPGTNTWLCEIQSAGRSPCKHIDHTTEVEQRDEASRAAAQTDKTLAPGGTRCPGAQRPGHRPVTRKSA